MKRIKKENIKKTLKLLKEIKLNDLEKKSQIFFPIDTERAEDFDGLELAIKHNGTASKKVLTPGLVISKDEQGKTLIILAYADVTYSPEFDMIQHLEILDTKISKELRAFLVEAECLIVKEDYISGYFSL